jgi:membrane-bound lytic murein transglycosylase D
MENGNGQEFIMARDFKKIIMRKSNLKNVLLASVLFTVNVLSGFAFELNEERPERQIKDAQYKNETQNFFVPKYAEVKPGIPGLEKEQTQSLIERYSKGGNKTWLKGVLEQTYPYISFVKERVSANALPPELLYLPLIESEYNPNVISKSGAAGMWQFMTNSMHPWLKANEWYDERHDFWASTDAALAKLKLNHNEFKDWAFALAAYNSGSGAIKRIISQNPGKDYWSLAEKNLFKAESLVYVPKLLAVYWIAENPRRSGFEDFWPPEEGWTKIILPQQTDLRLLAWEARIPYDELKAANAELKYNLTPPGIYHLKVKSDDSDIIQKIISDTDFIFTEKSVHVVEKGDTFYSIARRFEVSQASLIAANPGIKPETLRIGQRLSIPLESTTPP